MARTNDPEAPLASHDEDVPPEEPKEHREEVSSRCQQCRERKKPLFVLVAVIVICGGLGVGLNLTESNKMTDKTLVLIIGGEIGGEPTNDVTSHIPHTSAATCNKTSNFPLAVSGPVGVVLDQAVLVCGGSVKRPDGTHTVSNECYRLEKPGWVRTSNTLTVERAFPAGLYLHGKGLWITGGLSAGGEILKSSEFVRGQDDNVKVVESPVLPSGLSHHCLVKLSNRKTLIIGGKTKESNFSSSVWIFDWQEMVWTAKPNLNFGRHGHVCTFDRSRNIVIVAGGMTEDLASNKVEILDLTTDQWKVSPPLSKPVLGGSFIKIDDLHIIVGGSAVSDKTTLQLTGNEAFAESHPIFKTEVQNQRQYPVVLDVHENYVCFEE